MPEYRRETEISSEYRPPFQDGRESEGEEFSFLHAWSVLMESKWLIVAIVALFMLAGRAYLFLATPIYKTDVLIQLENEEKTLATGVQETASQLADLVASGAEMEILRSRMVLGKVVENLRLEVRAAPEYFPLLGRAIARRYADSQGGVSEPRFNLSNYAWGGEKIRVETLLVPDHLLGANLILVAGKDNRFTLLGPEEEEVLLDGEVGKRAQRELGANQSLQLFVSSLKARPGTRFVLQRGPFLATIGALQANFAVKEKGSYSRVLELTLRGTDPAQTAETLNQIANTYLRQNLERRSEEAEKRLRFLEKQLPLIKEQLDTSEKAFNAFRQQQRSVDLEAETKSLLDQVIGLESDLRTLDLKKGELLQRFAPEHPQVRTLEAEIAKTKGTLNALNEKISTLPQTQQDLLRFERDVKVNTELYTTMLNTLQELRLAKAGTIGTVRIIDHAVLPMVPESPQPGLVKALSVIVGFFFGIVLIILRRAFHAGVDDPDQVERVLSLPVYAAIPFSEEQKKLGKLLQGRRYEAKPPRDLPVLIERAGTDSPVVESLRSLRTTLHFGMLDARSNSILITGPRPGVGKSFLTVNLGALLAESGKRVLLIDADLRKGHLHRYFMMPRDPGLSDYISEELEAHSIIRSTPISGLDIIPTGTLPPNPSVLLMNARFAALLQQAGDPYDFVLLDSPPVLAATDAVIVGRLAGACLMVVQSGVHPMRELRDAAKRLQQGGVNLGGVIFNQMPLAKRGYGYGKYAYHYSYKRD